MNIENLGGCQGMTLANEFDFTSDDFWLEEVLEDEKENECVDNGLNLRNNREKFGNVIVMFDKLNLTEVLSNLHKNGYTLDSIGLGNTWSIVNSTTICGFRGVEDFCYIAFYFDTEVGAFVTKVFVAKERMFELLVNENRICLNRIGRGVGEEISTLIRGFDIVNFREFNLV